MLQYIPIPILCFFYQLYALRARIYEQKLKSYEDTFLSDRESPEQFIEKMIKDQLESYRKICQVLRNYCGITFYVEGKHHFFCSAMSLQHGMDGSVCFLDEKGMGFVAASYDVNGKQPSERLYEN